MTTPRRKAYEKKIRTPVDAPTRGHLRLMLRLLDHLDKHGDLSEFNLVLADENDAGPIARHATLLRAILAGDDARVVMGQSPGRGRKAKADDHERLAVVYRRAKRSGKTHAAACKAVRAAGFKLTDDSIKRFQREHRERAEQLLDLLDAFDVLPK